jgi:hypothetical protein
MMGSGEAVFFCLMLDFVDIWFFGGGDFGA